MRHVQSHIVEHGEPHRRPVLRRYRIVHHEGHRAVGPAFDDRHRYRMRGTAHGMIEGRRRTRVREDEVIDDGPQSTLVRRLVESVRIVHRRIVVVVVVVDADVVGRCHLRPHVGGRHAVPTDVVRRARDDDARQERDGQTALGQHAVPPLVPRDAHRVARRHRAAIQCHGGVFVVVAHGQSVVDDRRSVVRVGHHHYTILEVVEDNVVVIVVVVVAVATAAVATAITAIAAFVDFVVLDIDDGEGRGRWRRRRRYHTIIIRHTFQKITMVGDDNPTRMIMI